MYRINIEYMVNQDKKDNRGGKREGAGRPKGTSKLYAFRADKEVSAFIDEQENKTEFIRDCIFKELQVRQSFDADDRLSKWGEMIPANRIKSQTIPFFDVKIVAGFPIPLNNDELAQDIDLIKMICPNPDASYLIRVQGNSMIEANVHDGDILVVDKSNRNPSEKQIAVCELNGEYTVKYVIQKDNRSWLVPANPDFPEIEITDGDSFSVWGVVTYILHKPS